MKITTYHILFLALNFLCFNSFSQSYSKYEITKEKSGKYSLIEKRSGEIVNKYKNCELIDSIHDLKFPTNEHYKDYLIIQKGKSLILYSTSREKEVRNITFDKEFSITISDVEIERNELHYGRIDPNTTRNFLSIYAKGKDATIALLFNLSSEKFISAISTAYNDRGTNYELIKEDLILINQKDLFQVIDKNGKKIVPMVTDYYFRRFNGGFVFVNDEFKFGAVNYKGDTIAQFIYEDAQAYINENFAILENSEERAGVINAEGKILIPFKYRPKHPNYYRSYSYSDYGVFMLYKRNYNDSNFVFIDTNGVELIKEATYQDAWEIEIPIASSYNNRYYFVTKTNVGIFDTKQKKEIVPCMYNFFKDKYETQFGVISAVDVLGNWGLLSLENGTTIIPFEYESKKTEFIYTTDSVATYILCKNGKYGIINDKGLTQLPFVYTNVTKTSYENFVIVEKEGVYGLFDVRTSSFVLPIEMKTIYKDLSLEKLEGGKLLQGKFDTDKRQVKWK